MTDGSPDSATGGSPGPGEDAHTVRLAVEPDAERVRDAVSERVRDAVTDSAFCQYLRRAHEGPVAAGDEWAEFVSAGCGTQTRVSIRVLAVEGGTRIGPETAFEWG